MVNSTNGEVASILSAKAARPVGNYPHAKWVGQQLYLSGIGPRTLENSIPGNVLDANGDVSEYSIELQTHSVFSNVKAVLAQAGLQLCDLVDVTVYLTDMRKDFGPYNKIWATYFPDAEHAPCRTTVGISSLPTPIAIELKCIAQTPAGMPTTWSNADA